MIWRTLYIALPDPNIYDTRKPYESKGFSGGDKRLFLEVLVVPARRSSTNQITGDDPEPWELLSKGQEEQDGEDDSKVPNHHCL